MKAVEAFVRCSGLLAWGSGFGGIFFVAAAKIINMQEASSTAPPARSTRIAGTIVPITIAETMSP